MKKIQILLSSALTLLLITGNNVSYASPHYSDFNGRPGFKVKQPNMNAFKGQVKKGNVFNATPRRSESRDSGKVGVRNSQQNWGYRVNERGGSNKDIGWWTLDGSNLRNKMGGQEGEAFNPTSKYSISDEPAFIPKPDAVGRAGFRINQSNDDASGLGYRGVFRKGNKLHDSVHCVNPSNCLDKSTPKFGEQEGEAFNPTSKYSISDEPVIIPKPDGALGPDVVTTLEHGPGIVSTGGAHAVNDNDSRITFPDDLGPPGIVSGTGAHALQQPKGVPLKFINGEWR